MNFFSGEAGGAGVAGLETGGPQKMCHHDDDDHKNTPPPIHGRSILIYVTFWIHLCQILLKFQFAFPRTIQKQ